MNWTLRQLRLFEATARLGRLTLAADEQAISQSAASQALRELEKSLGYPLLVRAGRELRLSDAGEQVLPRVRQLLNLAAGLARPEDDSVVGPLRIAASVTIACYVLPPRLAAFKTQYPGAEPQLDIDNTRGVLDRLARGRAQLGLIEGPALHPQLTIRPWRDDELALFCAPEHPFAKRTGLSAAELADQDWILREAGSGTRAVFDTAFQEAGLNPRAVLELTRQEAIKQSVRAGLGVGCLSALAIVDELAAGQVVRLDTDLNLRRRFSWVCSPENTETPLVRAFLNSLGAT